MLLDTQVKSGNWVTDITKLTSTVPLCNSQALLGVSALKRAVMTWIVDRNKAVQDGGTGRAAYPQAEAHNRSQQQAKTTAWDSPTVQQPTRSAWDDYPQSNSNGYAQPSQSEQSGRHNSFGNVSASGYGAQQEGGVASASGYKERAAAAARQNARDNAEKERRDQQELDRQNAAPDHRQSHSDANGNSYVIYLVNQPMEDTHVGPSLLSCTACLLCSLVPCSVQHKLADDCNLTVQFPSRVLRSPDEEKLGC